MDHFNKYYFYKVKDYTTNLIQKYPRYHQQLEELYYSLLIKIAKDELYRIDIQTFYKQTQTLISS